MNNHETHEDALQRRVLTLERELTNARTEIESHRRRADLSEASARVAWRMASWGGARRDAEFDNV